MSEPEDTRESATEAGTQAVPATSAPPSFGGSGSLTEAPPGDTVPTVPGTEPVSPAPHTLTPFGPQTPWWAAESQDPTPQPVSDPAPAPATEAATGDTGGAQTPDASPGTLVAGIGVPSVDSRRAVPAEPIDKAL